MNHQLHTTTLQIYTIKLIQIRAEEHYLKVLKLKSDDPMPYINISNYYLKNTKYKKCVSVLEQALDKQIKSKELLNNLGIAYLATKDNEKSKMMFEEALKIDANYKPALDNLENLKNIDIS